MNFNESVDLLDFKFIESKKEVVNYTKRNTIKLDENGVLIYKIPYTGHWDYYPIFMSRYAIGYLGLYLEKNKNEYLDKFFAQIKWLYNNLKDKNNIGVWEHNYKMPYFKNFKIPWVHGLGQALGMVALLKAYELTDEQKYLDSANKVLNSFDVSIKDGGVKYIDDKEQVWYEEYCLIPAPHVLNGFITILFALNEFNRVTASKKAQRLYNEGLKTVIDNIGTYDLGYWSKYDLLRGYPCTKSYHNLHIWQLKILYKLTKNSLFKKYSKRWGHYKDKNFNTKKASVMRGFVHIKRYGPINCIKRYYQRKKWNK